MASLLDATPGTYDQERLYILGNLDRIDANQKEDTATVGGIKERQTKHSHDLNELHSRVRSLIQDTTKLSRTVMILELRAGYIAAATGALTAAIWEVVKWLYHH